jgi:hypothetical protein
MISESYSSPAEVFRNQFPLIIQLCVAFYFFRCATCFVEPRSCFLLVFFVV